MDLAAPVAPADPRVACCTLPGAAAPDAAGRPFVLLAPPDARVRPDAVAAACARLERAPQLGGVIDLEAPDPASSIALDLCLWPEHVEGLLIRAELLWALPACSDPADLLARAHWALAAASVAELAASGSPLVEASVPVRAGGDELARYHGAAVRAFAVEDLYPLLRAPGGMHQFLPCLLDWTSRLLRRETYAPGFALGDYAMSILERRNPGCGPRISAAPCEPGRGDPRVTLIVPTLDRPLFLERALQSLAEQTCQDFEVIVVNDGGRDPAAVLERFRPRLAGGGRLTVVHHDRNRGLAAARNTGLRLARGRYVGFLDDDDRLLPHHLAVLLPALARGARAVHGDTRSVGEVGTRADALPCTQSVSLLYCSSYAPLPFQLDNQFPVHSVLCERALLVECGGFDESLPVLEDWDLWLRVFALAPPLRVPRVVCEVRTRSDGSRMTEQRARRWPLALAHIYGKTLQRERVAPGLRVARLRHLLQVCRERAQPFPREAQTWLAGGEGLGAIDPDDPLRFLES